MSMTPEEFDTYCTRHRLSPSARAFIERVRMDMPARRVGGGTKNVANRFASRKMGFVVQAESENPEFAYVTTLEHDPDVLEFYDQPETLSVEARDKNGRKIVKPYTPDFLVLTASRGPVLVECKRDEFVEKRLEKNDPNWWVDPQGGVHYEPGRRWAESQGLAFRLVRSSDIPARRVQNLQMLADYYLPEAVPPADEARSRVLAALLSPPWRSRRQLLDADPAITADALNWMIAHGELYVDLDRQVLADDVRTLIFRDRAAAEAYAALQACESAADPLAVRAVTLEPGSVVVWDGARHTVLQVGETHVFLQGADGSMCNLPLREADRLIAQGLMAADPSGETTTTAAAQERLKTASPKDLEVALKQMAKLNAGPNDPPVPPRTRDWLRRQYKLGEKLYGNGFLGLIPNISKRGNRKRKLGEAVLAVMREIVEKLLLKPSPETVTCCYGEASLQCKEQALKPPSERSFRLYVKRLRRELVARVTQGHKAAHQYEPWHIRLSYETPRHGQRPFEIGHIDHTELDVHFVDEAYGQRTLRAWLTVLLDAYSRKVLSWFLTFDKPSHRSVMCVIRECLRRHGRGCDLYVVDQGAEFNGTYFEVLLARLSAHKRERPASKPRFGNLIERFFGLTTESLLKQLEGNNRFLKNPRSLSPSHDPRRRSVWTLREFERAWEGWLEQCYHACEHGTLGASPDTVFDEGMRRYGYRGHRRFAFDEAIRMLCLPSVPTADERLKVDAHHGHVKVHGVHYHGEVLRDGKLHGKRLPCRYDPFDVTRLYVYLAGRWHELRCAFAGDFEGMSLADIRLLSEEIRAKNGGAHRRREHNLEMLAQYVRTLRQAQEALKVSAEKARAGGALHPAAGGESGRSDPPTQLQPESVSFDVEAHWAGVADEPTGEF